MSTTRRLLTLSLLILAGCGADARIANLSPDVGAVDIYIDGALEFADVAFTGGSEYLTLGSGDHRIEITPAGESSPVLLDVTINLPAQTFTTIAVIGIADDLQVLALDDESVPVADQALVRLVHAAPDAGPADLALTGGDTLFNNVAFGDVTDYLILDPGTVNFQLLAAGADTVLLDVPDVVLPNSSITTLYAVGLTADDSLQLLSVADDNSP